MEEYDLWDHHYEQCSDLCVPPVFDLPPPPRPPWLEDVADCLEDGGGHYAGGLLCPADPTVHVVDGTASSVQGIFHSVITVVVAASAIVISLILMAVIIWRQRGSSRGLLGHLSTKVEGGDDLTPRSTNSSTCHHQIYASGKKLNHYSHNLVHLDTGLPTLSSPHKLINLTPTKSRVATLDNKSVTGGMPTLIIGGVPFHVVRRESVYDGGYNSTRVSNSTDSTTTPPPIYETIEDGGITNLQDRVYAQLENVCDKYCKCGSPVQSENSFAQQATYIPKETSHESISEPKQGINSPRRHRLKSNSISEEYSEPFREYTSLDPDYRFVQPVRDLVQCGPQRQPGHPVHNGQAACEQQPGQLVQLCLNREPKFLADLQSAKQFRRFSGAS